MTIHVHHSDMLQTAARPRVTIPDLWDRVRGFLVSAFADHGTPRAHLHRRLNGKERSAILRWLSPLEKMARQLLVSAAITHLLMTEQGRRTRANATPFPVAPAPPAKPPAAIHTGINLWATVACYHVSHAQSATTPPPSISPVDPDDPATWRAPFRILKRGGGQPPPTPPRRNISAGPPDPRRLIRRLEALRRVLEAPEPYVRRLATVLARVPRGALSLSAPRTQHRGRPNPTLRDELFALHTLLDPAVDAFNTS